MRRTDKAFLPALVVLSLTACGGGGGSGTDGDNSPSTSTQPAPIEAKDDSFPSVRVDSVRFPLAVLNNDTRDPSAHAVECVSRTTSGGKAEISDDGQFVLYTAPAGFTGPDSFRYRADGDEALVDLRVIQPDEAALGVSSSAPSGDPINYTESSPINEIRHSQENLEIGVTNYVDGIRNVGDEPQYHKVDLERGVTYRIEVGYYGKNQPLIPQVRFYDYHFIRRAQFFQQGGSFSFDYEARYTEPHFIEVLSDYVGNFDGNTCTSDCRSEIRVDIIDDFNDDLPTNGQAGGTYPIEAALEEAGDVDLFSVEMTNGEFYEFTVEAGTLQDISVELYSASNHNNILVQGSNSGSGADVTIARTATESNTHYVRVTGGTGTYRLVSRGGDIPRGTDTWARLGGRNVSTSHTSNLHRSDDQDMFRLALFAGEPVRLVVAADAPDGIQAPRVGLRDSVGDELLASTELDAPCAGCPARSTSLNFTPRRSGTYYADAGSSMEHGDLGTYTISIEDGDAADPGVDEYRGSALTNAYIESNRQPMYGALQQPGDEDWFNIDVDRNEHYRIFLEGLEAGGGDLADPRVRLVDQDGTVLFEAVETLPGIQVLDIHSSISYNPGVSSQAYVVVDSASGTGTGSYTLRREGGDPPKSQNTWAMIAPGAPIEGYYLSKGGDTDTYRLEVSEGHTYLIDAEGVSTGMGTVNSTSLKLSRLGETDTLVEDVVVREVRNAQVLYTAPADEIVFVETFTTSLPGTYLLTVTDLDADVGCP